MDGFAYGQVVKHPHPALDATYTYVAPIGLEGFSLFQDLQRQTGADGGSLDFGEGLAWWLRGEWSLPPRDDIVEQQQEYVLAVVSKEDARTLLDDFLKGR